jgi:methylated-DNA-[protein]-cysteine S-methyltransferase
MTRYTTTVTTPIGLLRVVGDGDALVALHPETMHPTRASQRTADELVEDAAPLQPIVDQLDEFFAGTRRSFDLELAPHGTPFQRDVWRALCTIPYGETATYGEIAAAIGRPTAVRAVGAANSRNPIMIVVPCHRVIGANGTLTGYAGGLDVKQCLLDLERRVAAA